MNSSSKEVILCIGSNCGARKLNVEAALKWLGLILKDFYHSHIYATPDCHGGQSEYMNAVGIGSTEMTPSDLDRICKDFEIRQGRDTKARASGDVPIDIDLVVYDGDIRRQRDYASEFFLIGLDSLRLNRPFNVKHPHCAP